MLCVRTCVSVCLCECVFVYKYIYLSDLGIWITRKN